MGKAKPDRNLAYTLYTGTDLPRYKIAEQARCTEKTLRDWIDKFGWEEIKTSQRITKDELRQTCFRQLQAIQKEVDEKHNGVPTKVLSDGISSISKMLEKLSDQPVHKYMEVLQDLTLWVSQNHPDKLKEQALLLGEYTQHVAQRIK